MGASIHAPSRNSTRWQSRSQSTRPARGATHNRDGQLFETGAGGSAPKHAQQFLREGHLRWDSLGAYCALVPSLELVAAKTGNKKAALLSKTLDQAIGQYLEDSRYPLRKVNEIDNRGSTFYLALAWAKALAANEAKITSELLAAQGKPVDIGGYYCPDEALCAAAMRPSATLNAVIDQI